MPERERIEAVLSSGKNDLEPSAGKGRSRELLFNRRENMLTAPNVKYSIPVCKEIKEREK